MTTEETFYTLLSDFDDDINIQKLLVYLKCFLFVLIDVIIVSISVFI